MPDFQRYRSGNVGEVKSKVAAGVQASIGDMVALVAGKVQTFASSGLTSATFRTSFLGILVQGATKGTETVDTTCLVYTDGEFEMPLSAAAGAAVDIGGLVAATANQIIATGAILGAAGTGTAIGRLVKRVEVGDTTAVFKAESVIFGGSQPLT